MPSSLLFGINCEGRVFGLSTNGTKWREFVYLGLEFKQLSAVPNSLWAVGGDRQVYVHVHGLDIPIRVKEEAYENERWTPVHGFSSRLLPTDRYHYSTMDGLRERDKTRIRLPSMAWQWEGDWRLECSFEGQPLDHDGWTYAVDFPATYYSKKQWTSCVRRRKWIRYRRYSALNSWCAIAPLHRDATQEPFIGVGVGGHEAGFSGGKISVWAVTAHGRVMFRTEVSATAPEGQRWNAVSLPSGCDVTQISVGASGLVWACLQNGKALVRTGITRDCILGTGWVEVPPPGENLLLNQVSLGCNGLWAITKNQQVWFRSGIRSEMAGASEELAKGSNWVQMIGEMASVSVAPNDQVFAIGAQDRLLYFRTAVTPEDLTGKTWRQVGAPTQLSRTSSVASLFSAGTGTVTPRDKRHRSWTSLNRHSVCHDTAKLELDFDDNCHSAPAFTRPIAFSQNSVMSSLPGQMAQSHGSMGSSSSHSGIPSSLPEEPEFQLPEIHESRPRQTEPNENYEDASHPVVGFPVTQEQRMKKGRRACSPLQSVGSVIGVEAHSEADSSVFDSEAMVGVYGEYGEREEEDDYLYWTDSEALWSFIEAGACLVHPRHPPGWFAETGAGKADLERPWRVKILDELRRRVPEEIMAEREYEKAIDTSSWVKTAEIRCLAADSWQEASLSLEWVEGENTPDCGTITISSPNAAATHAQCSIAELSAVLRCSEPGAPRFSLHRGVDLPVIKVQFSGEDDLEEWIGELHELCCHVRSLPASPSAASLWLTTALGDVHVFDAADLAVEQRSEDMTNYSIEIPFCGQYTPVIVPLYSGFYRGSSISLHGCVPDGGDRFSVNLACGDPDGDVAFHFNPRLREECVVRNARRSGVWGPEDRRGVQPFVPGQPFFLEILCEENLFRVIFNGKQFTDFSVRGALEEDPTLAPSSISHLTIHGDLVPSKIIYTASTPILYPPAIYFRHIGGHLRKVESAGGVTWGIGYDNTAWVYTGGTGGPFLKGNEARKNLSMVDSHTYYVYENQRWNPLTGYTSHGLPTDRHMWSDVTGRHKRTMDKTKLLSKRWQWDGDWAIDYNTPGGVDKKTGWQYAVDFPASYHGTKHLTDYVRRRRWRRRARLVTSGPWRELGHTPLADCCLHVEGNEIIAWGAALNGDVLYRRGVTASCPAGLAWEHVPCEHPILTISGGPGQLWGVGRSGCAIWRTDISTGNPLGISWETVDAPRGASLKTVSVGEAGVWALDTNGRVSLRKEVSRLFPSGSCWHTLPLQSGAAVNTEGEMALPTTPLSVAAGGYRHISAKSRVWAISASGKLEYRLGINGDNPAGTAWIPYLEASLSFCSAN